MKNANSREGRTRSKSVIIGLDGATFDVLDPYIRQGMLPNMASMIEGGVRGALEAAIPPVTGPSWVSFMTGMGPGKHGIFDFVKPRPDSIKRMPVSYRDIRTPTIWHYLDEAGKTMGVVNLPITYPPPGVKGFIIPGLLTPNAEGEFAHPVGLMDELRRGIGDYVLDVWWQRYGEAGVEKFLDELLYCTEQRIRAIFYLMENKPWDLFMGVFIGTDRIQHYLWRYIHPANVKSLSARDQAIVSKVAEYYKRVDRFFGNLMDRLDGKADLFVVSDHGFGPLSSKMYINRWLEEQGYLSVRRERVQRASKKSRLLQGVRKMVRVLDPLGVRKKLGLRMGRMERMSAYDFLDCIEWSNTRAYSVSNTEQGIYLNLRGREPQGIVNGNGDYHRLREEIIQRLGELRDPATGEKMASTALRREELYQGPHVENAPDIVLFLETGGCLIDVQLKETLFEEAGWHTGSGTHRMEGILIGYGPNIRKGTEITGARIVDMTPTLLYHQDLQVPEEMDGRPLLNLFREAFLEEHPLSYRSDRADLAVASGASHKLSDLEMSEVEEKLKGLGYL